MTYRPILPRLARALWRCLTQPDRPEPPPTRRDFEPLVDYIVHTDRDGSTTEWLRVHIDIDAGHTLSGTWPVAELDLAHDDCA